MLTPTKRTEFSKETFQEGALLLVDKPLGKTSFWVVNKIRYHIKKAYGIKKIKVGHAGTLDPLATGLLLVCTGKYTKRIPELIGAEKAYTGTFFIGATTPSYDLETEVNQVYETSHISEEMLQKNAENFIGLQTQTPPIFSAKKINGEKAYNLARKGVDVTMRKASIQIFDFKVEEKASLQALPFFVSCSKGTYIRSLAYDYGKALGSGAHLTSLIRTIVAEYSLEQAFVLEDILAELMVEPLQDD